MRTTASFSESAASCKGAADSHVRLLRPSGAPPQLAGAPLTCRGRRLSWRARRSLGGGAASPGGGATSPGGDATSPGGDAASAGGGAVSGVGRPPAFRVREAPNGFHCGESAARCSCTRSCSGVFHNPRPSHRRLCRKLPTCVVGLHRADSARRLSRSVGFALEKMANGG